MVESIKACAHAAQEGYEMSKISVIVPAYNCRERIEDCVKSILSQDHEDLELIAVDDGSSDGTGNILDRLAEGDVRLKVIHKENGGVSSARNRGIAEAEGEYIAFADADDRLTEGSLKVRIEAIEASGADMSIGRFFRVAGDTVSLKGSIDKAGLYDIRDYADEMMLRPADLYFGVLWNKLFRRDIVEAHSLRMDENISFSEDMIFVLEYLLHTESVAVTDEPVYYYNLTKGSLMEQGLNIPDVIKMKRAVIGYYADFYKKTLSMEDYYDRLPMIYGYLLAFSTDAINLPFSPATKKLGEEYSKTGLRSSLEALAKELRSELDALDIKELRDAASAELRGLRDELREELRSHEADELRGLRDGLRKRGLGRKDERS